MAYTSHTVIRRAIDSVKQTPLWQNAIDIARKNTYGKVYLVGGWVYRSITDTLYGMNGAPVSGNVDYDFLLTAEAKKLWLPSGMVPYGMTQTPMRQITWHWQGGLMVGGSSYQYPASQPRFQRRVRAARNTLDRRLNSATAVHTEKGTKVDLISLKDITPLSDTKAGTIEDYFNAVPLDIQAIAYDLEADMLYGPGIKAIQAKTLRWNNKKNLNPYHTPSLYIAEKARSLGFGFLESEQRSMAVAKHKCRCTHRLLWEGCKCGGE